MAKTNSGELLSPVTGAVGPYAEATVSTGPAAYGAEGGDGAQGVLVADAQEGGIDAPLRLEEGVCLVWNARQLFMPIKGQQSGTVAGEENMAVWAKLRFLIYRADGLAHSLDGCADGGRYFSRQDEGLRNSLTICFASALAGPHRALTGNPLGSNGPVQSIPNLLQLILHRSAQTYMASTCSLQNWCNCKPLHRNHARVGQCRGLPLYVHRCARPIHSFKFVT